METPKESLSALVDDELERIPAPLEQALGTDADLRDTWSRYHLIGDVLRQGDARASVARLDARVAAAIADEAVVLAPREPRKTVAAAPTRRPVVRFAVAAAVAGLALGVVLSASLSKSRSTAPELAVTTEPANPEGAQAVAWNAAGEPATVAPGDLRKRMNEYLVRFSQQRAGLAVPSVHPYVRIVGFEQEGGR